MNEKTTLKCIAEFVGCLKIIRESDLVQPKHGKYAIISVFKWTEINFFVLLRQIPNITFY